MVTFAESCCQATQHVLDVWAAREGSMVAWALIAELPNYTLLIVVLNEEEWNHEKSKWRQEQESWKQGPLKPTSDEGEGSKFTKEARQMLSRFASGEIEPESVEEKSRPGPEEWKPAPTSTAKVQHRNARGEIVEHNIIGFVGYGYVGFFCGVDKLRSFFDSTGRVPLKEVKVHDRFVLEDRIRALEALRVVEAEEMAYRKAKKDGKKERRRQERETGETSVAIDDAETIAQRKRDRDARKRENKHQRAKEEKQRIREEKQRAHEEERPVSEAEQHAQEEEQRAQEEEEQQQKDRIEAYWQEKYRVEGKGGVRVTAFRTSKATPEFKADIAAKLAAGDAVLRYGMGDS